MIKRKIEKHIKTWLESSTAALLVKGAKQVGKTTTIKYVLEQNDCDFVEVDLALFSNIENKSASSFLEELTLSSDHNFVSGKTIVFIKDIHEHEEFIPLLESLVSEGSYKYILSGLLLYKEDYIEVQQMFPLDFEEFCWALGIKDETIDYARKCFNEQEALYSSVHNVFMEAFEKYLIVGGMPQAVQSFLDNYNYNKADEIQKQILELYKQEFTNKNKSLCKKLNAIFDLIPKELNSQNKRFVFKDLNKEFRFTRYEGAFEWLASVGFTIPVYNCVEALSPLELSKKVNLFKLFLNDVGLLSCLYGKDNSKNGAMYENFVAQELHFHGYSIYYYNNRKYGAFDFLVEANNQVFPIEVKSGESYIKHRAFNNVNFNKAYVLSDKNLKVKNKIVHLPIYMTMFIGSYSADVKKDVFKFAKLV